MKSLSIATSLWDFFKEVNKGDGKVESLDLFMLDDI
jgi:hypothetical protein